MRISSLYALAALAQLISGHPSPASDPRALTPRRQTCSNNPKQLAGNSLPHPRGVADVPPGAILPNGRVWCDPNIATFVVITFIHSLPGTTVSSVLSAAIDRVVAHIGLFGNGNIPGGVFQFVNEGLEFYTENANNHQQTWAVLGAALVLVRDFMGKMSSESDGPGAVHLQIFDGRNQVAQGIFGYAGIGS